MEPFLIILGSGLGIWALFSWLSVRNIEEPAYEVVRSGRGYEIRRYRPYILAETTVTGAKDRAEAATRGFPIVAGYIFGGNRARGKIAMTAPVNTETGPSQKIAMTVPVNTEQEPGSGGYRISFVMPGKYTLETLPEPNDSRVQLREVPAREVAVRKFRGLARESAIKKHEAALMAALARDGVETAGSVNIARFNPPWTIPILLRNEVQIDIRQE